MGLRIASPQTKMKCQKGFISEGMQKYIEFTAKGVNFRVHTPQPSVEPQKRPFPSEMG